jgi:heme/copper-type cytochrome/quinol oxidase subunit 4
VPFDLKGELRKSPVQLGILAGTLALFLVANGLLRDSQSLSFIPPFIGILIVIEIVAFVFMEVKEGTEKHGMKHEIVDTVIALLVAVFIWYGASFVLNTSSPVSGVVSCSMLPNLQRGDFVIVQGAPVRAHEIDMTQAELDSLNDPASVTINGKNATIRGSIFPYCINDRSNAICSEFMKSPESLIERKGPFTYRYQTCKMSFSSGDLRSEPCLRSITFHGNEYLTDFLNDIVVYAPPQGDLYSMVGDIVHRTFFVINVDGKKYYLTRVDNNPILDLQVYDYSTGMVNHPIPQDRLRGKVIARIPYLGYFKLFISGYFKEDSQCKTQLEFEHI